MKSYMFTAFEKTGKLITQETWEFSSDSEAKIVGAQKIEEKNLSEVTHRLVNNSGKLLLFHV